MNQLLIPELAGLTSSRSGAGLDSGLVGLLGNAAAARAMGLTPGGGLNSDDLTVNRLQTELLLMMAQLMAPQRASTGTPAAAPDTGAAAAGPAAAAPAGAANGVDKNKAVQEVAQEMSKYKYQFYWNDKKSNQSTRSEKKGNCVDLSQLAVEEFQKRGVEAKVVKGQMNSSSFKGGHAWVNFKDSNGQWKFFDPVASANGKGPEAAFKGLPNTRYAGEGPLPGAATATA